MKRRIFTLTVLLLALVILASSCAQEIADETATVRFSITNDRTRTIAPDETRTKITQYRFTLSDTADHTFTFDRNETGTYTIKGIAPGGYDVKVEALTSNSTVVSEASVRHFFARGANNFNVTLTTLKGSQTLALTFLWKPAAYEKTPEFTVTLTSQDGTDVPINDGELVKDMQNGRAVLTKTLAAGSYLVSARIHEGTSTFVGYTEVVRLTNGGENLTAEVDFKSVGQVNNSGTVIQNVDIPIEGTISAENDEKGQIVADLTITSMPEGIEESDITITWYNEHYKLPTDEKQPKHIEFYGMSGTTLITAVMTCSKTGAMGSATLYFDNQY